MNFDKSCVTVGCRLPAGNDTPFGEIEWLLDLFNLAETQK